MGHRHLHGTSQMFDNEHDQGWNHVHAEQPCINLARSRTTDGIFNPVENMTAEGMHFSSNWNSAPRPNGYTSSGHVVEGLHYQSDASGSSHGPFPHSSSTTGICSTPTENYGHYASSSNYNSQTWESGNFVDVTIGNARAPQKRRNPGASSVYERGSSSRYYSDRNSSNISLPTEKSDMDSHYMTWDQFPVHPTYRSNGLSIRGEDPTRNVRSRPTIDLESDSTRTDLLSNSSHSSISSSHVIDHSSSIDFSGQTSHTLPREWNRISLSPVPGDISGFNPEANNFLAGDAANNISSVEMGGYHHGSVSSRNPITPQSFPGSSAQSASGLQSSYSQRSIATNRASYTGLRLGRVAHPDDRSQLMTETYPSRHLRALPRISWRSNDRSGRRRSSYERLLPPEVALHDRFSSEAFMVADRSAFYASRNMFDQHRDMRLDVDSMTYEELLALGDRIGSVNTGLCEASINNCLRETLYCSSDQGHEGGRCVICLEEYKEKDNIGSLKTCRHDYHVSCIKKWLSMKNSCPICKGAALSDKVKN